MELTIHFPREELTFYSIHPTGDSQQAEAVAHLFTSETVIPKNNMLIEPNTKTLEVLNKCVYLLNNAFGQYDIEEIAYNVSSLNTFIDEAVQNKEYCQYGVLTEIAPFLHLSLTGWEDRTRRKTDEILKGLSSPLTADDLKKIVSGISHPQTDTYYCKHDVIPCFYIQVAFSILSHYLKQGVRLKRCNYCGNLFIPKANEKNCMRVTDGKTCREHNRQNTVKNSQNREPYKTKHSIMVKLRQRGAKETLRKFQSEYDNCKTQEEQIKCVQEWAKKIRKTEPKK